MRASIQRIIRDQGNAVFTDGNINTVIDDAVADMTLRVAILRKISRIDVGESPPYSYTHPWEVSEAGLDSMKVGRESGTYVRMEGPSTQGYATYSWEIVWKDLEQEALWALPADLVTILKATYDDSTTSKRRINPGSKFDLDLHTANWPTISGTPTDYIVDQEDPLHFMTFPRSDDVSEYTVEASSEYGVIVAWTGKTFDLDNAYGTVIGLHSKLTMDGEYGILVANRVGSPSIEFTHSFAHPVAGDDTSVFAVPRPYQPGIIYKAVADLLALDSDLRNLAKAKIMLDLYTNILRRMALAMVARRVVRTKGTFGERVNRRERARLPQGYPDFG